MKIFNTLLESSQIEELFINPRRGLIAYYPFNADNGTAHPLLDLSGQDNDLRGSPSLVDGFSGSSKAIKGSVSTPDFNLDNYSISMWIHLDSADNTSLIQTSNNVLLATDNGSLSTSGNIISGIYLPERFASHFVLTRNSTTGILYHLSLIHI